MNDVWAVLTYTAGNLVERPNRPDRFHGRSDETLRVDHPNAGRENVNVVSPFAQQSRLVLDHSVLT
jgi:hypothetical protein